jgi:hypothetical protein
MKGKGKRGKGKGMTRIELGVLKRYVDKLRYHPRLFKEN